MNFLGAIIGAGIGSLIGVAVGFWGWASSSANIIVRPELANVDWWTALLANHFSDWLFYHNPMLGFIAYIIPMTIILGLMGWILD